jgi:hypothetical protein
MQSHHYGPCMPISLAHTYHFLNTLTNVPVHTCVHTFIITPKQRISRTHKTKKKSTHTWILNRLPCLRHPVLHPVWYTGSSVSVKCLRPEICATFLQRTFIGTPLRRRMADLCACVFESIQRTEITKEWIHTCLDDYLHACAPDAWKSRFPVVREIVGCVCMSFLFLFFVTYVCRLILYAGKWVVCHNKIKFFVADVARSNVHIYISTHAYTHANIRTDTQITRNMSHWTALQIFAGKQLSSLFQNAAEKKKLSGHPPLCKLAIFGR